jgi:hypothetical protein
MSDRRHCRACGKRRPFEEQATCHLSGSENRWKRKVYSGGRKSFLRQRGKLFHCGTAPVEISNLRNSRNLCFVAYLHFSSTRFIFPFLQNLFSD